MQSDNLDYLRRRELAERAAAKNATSGAARRVHQELAQSYAELSRSVSAATAGPGSAS
ncbi:MAG TPA: hypothetical protein VIL42_09410 [Sphingomicrobium sp.]